jgi:hypothetical protein
MQKNLRPTPAGAAAVERANNLLNAGIYGGRRGFGAAKRPEPDTVK